MREKEQGVQGRGSSHWFRRQRLALLRPWRRDGEAVKRGGIIDWTPGPGPLPQQETRHRGSAPPSSWAWTKPRESERPLYSSPCPYSSLTFGVKLLSSPPVWGSTVRPPSGAPLLSHDGGSRSPLNLEAQIWHHSRFVCFSPTSALPRGLCIREG